MASRGVTTVPPPIPSRPEATPAVAPVMPRRIVVVHGMSLKPETADWVRWDRLTLAGLSGGTLLTEAEVGFSDVTDAVLFWNRNDCKAQRQATQ